MALPHGVKEYTKGGVTLAFYSYRSLHTDIVQDAIRQAVPEANDYTNESVKAGYTWFLLTVPHLRDMRFADTLDDDEMLLQAWWSEYEQAMRDGEWRKVWEGYALLSYEAQLIFVDGFNATRRQVIGTTEGVGGSDNTDPKKGKPASASRSTSKSKVSQSTRK